MGSVKFKETFGQGVDFVFIDGLHTYEGVVADITSWRPLVKARDQHRGSFEDWEEAL